MASKIAKNVVSLAEILESTPVHKRHLVIIACNDAFREEFLETVLESPELKLIFGGQSIFSVVRYMVDRNLIASEKLETLDWILESKIIWYWWWSQIYIKFKTYVNCIFCSLYVVLKFLFPCCYVVQTAYNLLFCTYQSTSERSMNIYTFENDNLDTVDSPLSFGPNIMST